MANLYDKASLVQIPSGYKDGKLYNIKPFDQPFEFSRGSAATRVNEDGLIETFYDEATNLLLQSNNFDTTWTIDNYARLYTPTSGILGYDGTNDGWLLDILGDTTSQNIRQSLSSSGVQTFSVYAKANTLDWMLLYVSAGTLTRAYFDIANGSLGSTNNLIESKITDAGNGWYRCSITFNASITDVRIYLANANGSLTQSSGSIYIQDAQLESGYFATPYIETTTEAVTRPNRHDTPRIDYTNGKSLLLEPQRTNLIEYSEDFTQWTSEGGIEEALNSSISPDGLNNATKLELTATDGKSAYYISSLTGDHTFSVFAKKGSHNVLYLWVGRTSNNITRWIDLENGVESGSGSGDGELIIEDFGNDWFRISLTFDATDMTRVNLEIADSGQSTAQIGDNIYVYGAQLEQGSYATSYIPTNGQAETRLADVCQGGGDASVFNSQEGVLYAEMSTDFEGLSGVKALSVQYDGNNYVSIYFRDNNNLSARVVGSGNITQVDTSYVISSLYKIAVSYNSTNVKFYVNGTQVDIETTNTLPTSLNKLSFDRGGVSATNMNGNIKALHYFPEALTDTELQTLTTI